MRKAFICTNQKQLFGARLAKFAIERASSLGMPILVELIEVENRPEFQAFVGTRYRYNSREERVYTLHDLQSFTLTRFLPPMLMGYEGQAFVIDPDIFALADPHGLFSYLDSGAAIAACPKKDAWDTSVMVLDCAQLKHWDVSALLEALKQGTNMYEDFMTLKIERTKIQELPRMWNSLDHLDSETKMLHTTNRLTQPWKTGLPIDFTRNRLPPFLGLLPREPLLHALGRYPSRYQPHPDKAIESFFFALVRDALAAGVVTRADIEAEINKKHVRSDFFSYLKQ